MPRLASVQQKLPVAQLWPHSHGTCVQESLKQSFKIIVSINCFRTILFPCETIIAIGIMKNIGSGDLWLSFGSFVSWNEFRSKSASTVSSDRKGTGKTLPRTDLKLLFQWTLSKSLKWQTCQYLRPHWWQGCQVDLKSEQKRLKCVSWTRKSIERLMPRRHRRDLYLKQFPPLLVLFWGKNSRQCWKNTFAFLGRNF